jgi:hypothetical protein
MNAISPLVPVLLVVHPDSACGRGDASLGALVAKRARRRLIQDLHRWSGDVLILDGDFADELEQPEYTRLGAALADCRARAEIAAHQLHYRTLAGGADLHWDERAAVRSMAEEFFLTPDKFRFEVTGCWYDPTGRDGCVNSVAATLTGMGFAVDVRDSAISIGG